MSDEKKSVKKKMKPRGGNNILTDAALKVEPGDNAKYIKNAMQLGALPKIDLRDSDAVADRITEFFTIQFENDLKPTVSGLAMALGLDRRRLWEIKTGNFGTQKSLEELPTSTKDSIKKAYEMMENLWENYMQNNKINVVAGIFLGKNNFGYQDKQEHVITPNTHSDSEYSAEDIRKRYLTDSDARLLEESTTSNSEE